MVSVVVQINITSSVMLLFNLDLIFNSFTEIFTYHETHSWKVYSTLSFSRFTELYHHHHYLILEHFHKKCNRVPVSSHSLFPPPSSHGQLLIYFLSSWTFPFWIFPGNGIIYYVAFCVCNPIRFENVELLVIFSRWPPTVFVT